MENKDVFKKISEEIINLSLKDQEIIELFLRAYKAGYYKGREDEALQHKALDL